MPAVFKFIFERLTDPLGLPINALYEYLILAVIGFVAYAFSFAFVGVMYENDDIGGSTAGSFFHWVIRLVIFTILWGVTYFVIWLVKIIFQYWIVVLSLVLALSIIVVSIIMFVKYRKKKSDSNQGNIDN